MMETDIAVGSGLKVTCDRDELVAKLATVSRVVSTRGIGPGSLRRAPAPHRRRARARRHRHGALAPHDAHRERRGRQLGRRARQAPRRPGAAAAGRRGHDRVPARGRRRARLERELLLEAERVLGRGLPAPPVGRPGAAHDRDRVAARDRRPRRALGLEGRVAARADRHPGALRRHPAVHGRDRLVPPLVQADRARAVRARTSRRSSRPAPSPSSAASQPARRPSPSASTRTRSCSAPATPG